MLWSPLIAPPRRTCLIELVGQHRNSDWPFFKDFICKVEFNLSTRKILLIFWQYCMNFLIKSICCTLLYILLRPCNKWRGQKRIKSRFVPSLLMKFWSRNNLDQLDRLVPKNNYSVDPPKMPGTLCVLVKISEFEFGEKDRE